MTKVRVTQIGVNSGATEDRSQTLSLWVYAGCITQFRLTPVTRYD